MGGEVGAPAAHLGGLSVRKGRRRGWGLAPGPGPLPQVRGVRAHDRRSGKSHQEARSFREGGFCSGRKICSARKANNGKWQNCLCLEDLFFNIQFQFELKDMKRRQDEDMMRQQDLIDKQKEQARYGLIFYRPSHDLIDILSSFSDAKISQTPDQRREASREKVSRAFTYFSMSPLVMRLDSEWVKCAQCEFYLETALLIRLWLTSPSLLSPVSLSRARPVMQHNLAAHMKSTRLSNVKTPI